MFVGIKSWSYVTDEVYKPVSKLIHNYLDRISKNGYLLLNFGPTKEGNIPPEVVERFKEMDKWFKVNEEACFYSTLWTLAEEGPTKMVEKTGGFNEKIDVGYTAEDIRFVTKDNALYAFVLGWPGEELTIKSLAASPVKVQGDYYLIEERDIESIQMLGNQGDLSWHLISDGLKIKMPSEKPCDYAYTIKITWSDYANQ